MEEEDEFGNLYADLGPEATRGKSHDMGGDPSQLMDSDDEEYAEILFGKPPQLFTPSNSPQHHTEQLSLLGVTPHTPPQQQPHDSKAMAPLPKDSTVAATATAKEAPLPMEDATETQPPIVPELDDDDDDDFAQRSVAIPGLSTSSVAPNYEDEADFDLGDDDWVQKESAKRPPLSSTGTAVQNVTLASASPAVAAATGAVADWDSDSEDDLQIVLNEEHHMYPSFEKGAVADKNFEGSEDEDGEDLVIVAGGEPLEDQEWGGDQSLAPDGLQPTLGDKSLPVGDRQVGTAEGLPGKTSQTTGIVPQGFARMGYSGHPYHHHSQYKYVRPSSTVPGVGAASVGQVTSNRIALGKGGAARGDWSGPGRGLCGSQRMAQAPYWNAGASRGFQYGYEFSLPPTKTVFDIDIDSLEEKPWRHPAVDITDFFNFGFNESSWKDYCKQLAQLRLESTMQSKIRVYESGRSEQDYDPELPPELAAAAGLHEASGENTQLRHFDSDMTVANGRGSGHLEVIQTGRAIQVEGGFGDRRPSSDNRRPRFRDCDAIILHEAEEEELIKTQEADENARFEEEEGMEDVEEEEIEVEGKLGPEFMPKNQNDEAHFSPEVSAKVTRKIALRPSVPLQASEKNEALPGMHAIDTAFILNSEVQVVERNPAAALSSLPKESYTPALERHKVSRASNFSKELQSDQNLHSDHSHSSNVHQESDSTGEIKLDVGCIWVSPDSMKRSRTPEVTASAKSVEAAKEVPVGQESDKQDRTSVEDGLIQDGSPDTAHHADDSLAGEKERLSVEDGSHMSSPSKTTLKKHLDHGGEEIIEDDQGLDSMQHERQGRICREGKNLDDEDTYSHQRKDVFWANMQQAESETVMQAENSDEHLRRSREGTKEKGKLREHSVAREDSLNNAYIRRKEREGDAKHRIDFRKREESKSRERRGHVLDMPASRRKMDEEGRKRERVDREVELRHRERDSKVARRHNDEDDLTFRRVKEDELRRRERPENEQKERNKYRSERRAAREQDLYIRRRDEDIWRRERLEEYRQRKGRDEIWRERDDAHHRKGMHRDIHGRREKEEERSGQIGRSRRQVEENTGHATNAYVREALRIPGSDRDRTKEKRKRDTEQVKDRDILEGIRESESRSRSRNPLFEEEQGRNDAKHSFRTFEEQKLQTLRHKSDLHRNRESNADKVISSSLFLEDRNHRNYADIGLNPKEDNHQSGRDQSFGERRVMQKGDSAQNFPDKRPVQIVETVFSEEDEPRQRGRSKLERWASQRARENQGFRESELQDVKHGKRDVSYYNAVLQDNPSSSRKELCRKSDISRNDDSKTAEDEQKLNNKTEHEGDNQHDIEQDDEQDHNDGDPLHIGEFADEDQQHFHPPLKQQHLDMVAKLEKRKERFKNSITEDKELRRRMDNENSQQMDKEEVKAERPARKRRWGTG